MSTKYFLKFSIYYGHIWRSQFKNEHFLNLARTEWQLALEIFEEVVIEKALDECLKQREMPPTMSQFIDSCKQLANKNKGFYTPMEVKKASSTTAEENLKKMKLILNMRIQ